MDLILSSNFLFILHLSALLEHGRIYCIKEDGNVKGAAL